MTLMARRTPRRTPEWMSSPAEPEMVHDQMVDVLQMEPGLFDCLERSRPSKSTRIIALARVMATRTHVAERR